MRMSSMENVTMTNMCMVLFYKTDKFEGMVTFSDDGKGNQEYESLGFTKCGRIPNTPF